MSLLGAQSNPLHRVPLWSWTPELTLVAILVLAMIGIGAINPAFWQLSNLFGLVRGNLIIGIMALGMLVVMISGGIDVSFPAFAAAALYLTVKAVVATNYQGVVVPFACAIAIGAAFGAANAFFVYKMRLIPLIATLGTGTVVRGFLLGAIGTSQINIDAMPASLINFGNLELVTITENDGTHFGLSAMVLIYLALAGLLHMILKYTMLGRSIYALGADPEATKRVGFEVGKTTFFTYCFAGALAGLAGLLHSSMSWLANPRDFIGLELDVIAAVVLGGASIFGGRGSALGTMLGVFILVLVNSSLLTMHIGTTWQRVVVGVIIIIATAISAWGDRRRLA